MPSITETANAGRITRAMTEAARDAIDNNEGVFTAAAYERIATAALGVNSTLSDVERASLAQPREYLVAAGIDVDALHFEPAIIERARTFVTGEGTAPLTGLSTSVEAPTIESLMTQFNRMMETGKDLGSYSDWSLKTPGADVKFSTTASGRDWPALVLDTRTFEDPKPARDIVSENKAAFEAVTNPAEFQSAIDTILSSETDYFSAEDLGSDSANLKYGVANLRRKAFLTALRSSAIDATSITGGDKARARGVAEGVSIKMATGIDYQMEVGSHTNYWPYWSNYAAPLEKMLEQEEVGSAGYHQIKNRLNDINRRKTHNDSWKREVNERNFESSVKMSLVYSPNFTVGSGHRLSQTEDSTTFNPHYELITINKAGLPEEFAEYAGVQVYRDTNASKTLRVDFMGKGDSATEVFARSLTGKKIPEELNDHLTTRRLTEKDAESFTLRKFQAGEKARKNISFDWGSNGNINVAPTNVGWWGHCHNEAPLNAMAIDPQKAVSFYRADRGVDASKALANYTAADAWDIAGAFTSDHEGRPAWNSLSTGRATGVDSTSFVGTRNNGLHELNIKLEGGRSFNIDAEVISLKDASGKSQDPKAIFRENVENEDGGFDKNPMHLKTNAQKDDQITIDVAGCTMNLSTKYVTFDAQGNPTERTGSVKLDPAEDKFVKVTEKIARRNPGAQGGEILEQYYNAKTKEYYSITQKVNEENGYKREEVSRSETSAVSGLEHTTETEYDSVEVIFDYFMDNPGLPKTYDTSPDAPVWNYPVDREKLDLLTETTVKENGHDYTYRTFNLLYSTMGGPEDQNQKFIIKFNEQGKIVDTCALDPMPDFAYRQDHWTAAPVTSDNRGGTAYNVMALSKGYLLRQGGNSISDVETKLWEQEAALLFASLSDDTAEGHAYVFQKTDGSIISFADKASFHKAVEADKALRKAEANQ